MGDLYGELSAITTQVSLARLLVQPFSSNCSLFLSWLGAEKEKGRGRGPSSVREEIRRKVRTETHLRNDFVTFCDGVPRTRGALSLVPLPRVVPIQDGYSPNFCDQLYITVDTVRSKWWAAGDFH